MDSYIHFSVEDFVWDEAFRTWVLTPTREDQLKWELWLEQNPDKAQTVFQASELVRALWPATAHVSPATKQQAISEIMARFDAQATSLERPVRNAVFQWSSWMKIASSILLLLAFTWLFFYYNAQRNLNYDRLVSAADQKLREVVNTSQVIMKVTLPDGSTISLDPSSKLSFPERFSSSKREVYLSGSAFFDVVRQPSRPFYVYADQVVTKVLGTSFYVRSVTSDQAISVAVKSGRVAVFTREDEQTETISPVNELSGVVIEPNQQILVARSTAKMTKTLVADPQPILSQKDARQFDFDDSPVSEIFKTLQKAYGIEILFDENTMKECPVTARLADLSLYEKLDLVCNAVGASYEVIDGRVIVDGKGCQQM